MGVGGSYLVEPGKNKGKPKRIEGTADPDGPLGLRNAQGQLMRSDESVIGPELATEAAPETAPETPVKEA